VPLSDKNSCVVVCAEAVEEAEDSWVVTIAGAMVDGEMAATDLLDHGEDMVEVTEVGAAVGEEMATAVVARWPAAKEVVVDFEDEEDVEAVVHLTEKLTLFCLLQNFSTPSPPKKPKPHEPSLDARSLFLYVRFAADVI